MATTLELALMAGRAYESTRALINKIPTPDTWLLARPDKDDATGFEAVTFVKEGFTFRNSPEIVISFSGTDPNNSGLLTSPDGRTNSALANGKWSDQLLQAAKYYLDVKTANLDAVITFTGHSLGGGLAALMAVFFVGRAAH